MTARDLGWETSGDALDDEAVAAVEKHFGVRFPEDYRSILMRYHGGWPTVSDFSFTTPDGRPIGSLIGVLLTADREASSNIIAVHQGMGEYGDSKVIPISDDGGGDYVCLDYRSPGPDGEPSVCYFEHGLLEFHPLAATFADFCAMLKEPAEIE